MTNIPAKIEYPTRTPPAVRGRHASGPAGRWATIRRIRAGEEAGIDIQRDTVIGIAIMTPAERPPEVPGLDNADENLTNQYFLEQVASGVLIGMARGGSIDQVGGFGFLSDDDFINYELRQDGGFQLREDGGLEARG